MAIGCINLGQLQRFPNDPEAEGDALRCATAGPKGQGRLSLQVAAILLAPRIRDPTLFRTHCHFVTEESLTLKIDHGLNRRMTPKIAHIRRNAFRLVSFFAFALTTLVGLAAPMDDRVFINGHPAHPTRVLARRKPGVGDNAIQLHSAAKGKQVSVNGGFDLVPEIVILDATQINQGNGVTTQKAKADVLNDWMEELRSSGLFEYVEPDYYLDMQVAPSEPAFNNGALWGLNNTIGTRGVDIGAEAAWQLTTGSTNVIVAVIDSGIDLNHPDLRANLWTNPGEIPGNGRDDDGNGYVDDIHGIDLADPASADGPMDDFGHGTHVAGTIAATPNNGGVVGVAWRARLMAIRVGDQNGFLNSAILDGLDYAVHNGARIVNASYGGPGYSQAMKDAYSRAGDVGVMVICAAGNDSKNNDEQPSFPANYRLPNLMSVAAINLRGELCSFSNFGLDTVDIAAPGEDIFSTWLLNAVDGLPSIHRSIPGTSMAAPHVTGIAALILARNPNIGILELRQRLLQSTVPLPSLAGKVKTGGLVNAYRALANKPDGQPEFEIRPANEFFVAGRESIVEVAATDVVPLVGGSLVLSISTGAESSFRDDGTAPDRRASDGIYSGRVVPQTAGDQLANVRLQWRGQSWQRRQSILVQNVASNDFFINRAPLLLGSLESRGNMYGAGIENSEPDTAGFADLSTVWYHYVPAVNSTNLLVVNANEFEPRIRLYSGTSISNLRAYQILAQTNIGGLALIQFSSQIGTPVYISIASDRGREGDFEIAMRNISAPIPNDQRSNADVLRSATSIYLVGDNRLATRESGEPQHAGNRGGRSLWWRYSPPVDGVLELNTFGSTFDTLLAAYRVGSTIALASNDDSYDWEYRRTQQSKISFSVSRDTPIDIVVDGFNGDSGDFIIRGVLRASFNDRYDDSAELVIGSTIRGTNVGATKGIGEPNHGGDRGGASVWYRWRASSGGRTTVRVDPVAAGLRPTVAVYVGPDDILSVSDWNRVRLLNESLGGVASFDAIAGETYRIAVDGKFYQDCFLFFCSDAVEQGVFNINLSQESEVGLSILTGFETSLDVGLRSDSDSVDLANYQGASPLGGGRARRLSSTNRTTFHGYSAFSDIAGAKVRLRCSFGHNGTGGTNAGWAIGFLAVPYGYAIDSSDLLENVQGMMFAFKSDGSNVRFITGKLREQPLEYSLSPMTVTPNRRHTLELELDEASQSFKIVLDDGAPMSGALEIAGRRVVAVGPFIVSEAAESPYPYLLLDDLDVRVLPRSLGGNLQPTLAGATNATINELAGYTQPLVPQDGDVPAQELTVTLLSGPTGLVVTNGVLAWTPTETQGPSTNSVQVTVTDGFETGTNSFVIIVREVNASPLWSGIPDGVGEVGKEYVQRLEALDEDLPAQLLTFQLLEPIPGAVVESDLFRWTPAAAQAGTTNRIRVVASDGVASVESEFHIRVLSVSTPPTFDGLPELAGDRLRLRVRMEGSMRLEVSDNLIDWRNYSVLEGTQGSVITTEVPVEAGFRFFRLIREP